MITSASNSQIKNLIKLKKNGKTRKEQGVFLVEGIRMFREIPLSWVQKVYTTEDFFAKNSGLFQDMDYEVVTEAVFKTASDTMSPQGVMAVVKQSAYTFEDVTGGEAPCLIVLENLQDPGNLGTILRTGEGAGVTGILMSQDTVDIYNPKVIRSTMGSIYRVPFLYVEDLASTLEMLNDRGIVTYAAHLNGSSFYQENYKKGCAFLIGNEGNGLTKETANMAQKKIRIPMKGKVESLNAAVAATVLMYEAMRQRG